nr:Rieske 2Fe-2S domain-containing protein [Salsipaludibacter albus]
MVGRRGLLGGALATALSATGLAALVPTLSLGPSPGDALRHTAWAGAGAQRLVTREGRAVAVDELQVGGLLTVFPRDHVGDADAQAVLIRLADDVTVRAPAEVSATAAGHVAYSKVCTHAGCPVGLYEAIEQQLFCPCHQSSFDVVEGARPLMGPAARPLPQLPLGVDDEGFLVATGDFSDAVGPGWWSRP